MPDQAQARNSSGCDGCMGNLTRVSTMSSISRVRDALRSNITIVGMAGLLALCLSSVASAQGGRNWDGRRFTRLDPGMTINVRTIEPIDAARTDYRVYNGIVDRDVRGDDGRLAIPRGSSVELIVRR